VRAGIRTHIHLLPEVYTTTINVSSYYYFIPRHSLGVLEAQRDSQRDTHIERHRETHIGTRGTERLAERHTHTPCRGIQ
jgi:hypothetical protein